LDKVACFICSEAEEDMKPVHIARVETDRMPSFGRGVTVSHGIESWRAGQLRDEVVSSEDAGMCNKTYLKLLAG
jgi:hypothetical protein